MKLRCLMLAGGMSSARPRTCSACEGIPASVLTATSTWWACAQGSKRIAQRSPSVPRDAVGPSAEQWCAPGRCSGCARGPWRPWPRGGASPSPRGTAVDRQRTGAAGGRRARRPAEPAASRGGELPPLPQGLLRVSALQGRALLGLGEHHAGEPGAHRGAKARRAC